MSTFLKYLRLAYYILVITILPQKALTQTSKVTTFISVGSSGLGAGLQYKKYNLFARYFYEYYEDVFSNIYVYTHFPEISLTKDIYSEEYGSLYAGLSYTGSIYKQKYFFPGTYSSVNYSISIPLGVKINPFRKFNKLTVVLESGISFEHGLLQLHPLIKGYDWQLGLARGIVDIRYSLSRRTNNLPDKTRPIKGPH
jgi:hypothetical protein